MAPPAAAPTAAGAARAAAPPIPAAWAVANREPAATFPIDAQAAAAADPATGPAAENPAQMSAPLATMNVAAAETPDHKAVPPRISILIICLFKIMLSFL